MTGQNLTISIGRNIPGGGQLSQSHWDDFRDAVNDLAAQCISEEPGAQVVQRGTVTGLWDGEEEESYTVTVAGLDPIRALYRPARDITVRAYVEAIAGHLCACYRQDSIAVTWSTPEFIGPA